MVGGKNNFSLDKKIDYSRLWASGEATTFCSLNTISPSHTETVKIQLDEINELTFIGISAMTRLLLSSMFLRVTTSPPTTILITIPSKYKYNKLLSQ